MMGRTRAARGIASSPCIGIEREALSEGEERSRIAVWTARRHYVTDYGYSRGSFEGPARAGGRQQASTS
jgi:hypothetical protein